jgi:DNA-binding response OmpR family regulator
VRDIIFVGVVLAFFAIAVLRSKLEPDPARPRYLITEARMGYLFQPAGT